MIRLFNENSNTLDIVKLNANSLVFSSLSEFYQPVYSNGFSIKYVLEGIERYTLNKRQYPIETGSYLLSNNTMDGNVEIDKGKNVKGICINILPEFIAEVVASHQRPDTAYSDAELGHFFTTNLFFENQYRAQDTCLGKSLKNLTNTIQQNKINNDEFTIEFFYEISEQIIADQIPVFKQLQAIPSLKAITKKDLYRKLLRGRDFADNYFTHSLTIENIAQEACMSEYHFFRLFKSVFGKSPNQYLIQKRLELGQNMLHLGASVSIAASETGFADIYSFSKAFKKYFGVSPTHLERL
jgi:AraC family transcriptional regulator